MSAIKHGDTNTRLYSIWTNMCNRVSQNNNKNSRVYKEYYLRGIINERNSYEEFKKDMYDSYLKHVEEYGEYNTTIDRIDVNGNYCKKNCRRATRGEQQINRRFSRDNRFGYNKKDLAKKYGMSVHALQEFARRRGYNINIIIIDLEKKLLSKK